MNFSNLMAAVSDDARRFVLAFERELDNLRQRVSALRLRLGRQRDDNDVLRQVRFELEVRLGEAEEELEETRDMLEDAKEELRESRERLKRVKLHCRKVQTELNAVKNELRVRDKVPAHFHQFLIHIQCHLNVSVVKNLNVTAVFIVFAHQI